MAVGILLAAGFSRRFGTNDKLMHALPDGRAIALVAAQNLVAALPHTVAVVRPESAALAQQLTQAGIVVITCSQQEQEMADSLSTAIRYTAGMAAAADGFVVALADMPYICAQTISDVAGALAAGSAIVVPTYRGQRGHPVAFSAKFRSELEGLHGDTGARAIVQCYRDEVCLLECDDAGIVKDIDTLADIGDPGI